MTIQLRFRNLQYLAAKLASLALVFSMPLAFAEQAQALPDSPVTYQHIVRRDPNFSIHVVTINLNDPRVSVRVSRGGADPDGDGPWTTTLLPVSEIAKRQGFDIAINGDFFDAEATKDIEGRNTGYVRGKPATPEGMAMTDGQLWHRAEKARPCLAVSTNHTARFLSGDPAKSFDPDIREVLGGGQMIVSDGAAVEFTTKFATNRHPRTVAGLDRTGSRLVLMVVDGRQPKLSVGMTLHELSVEMLNLGCHNAINFDGGGSTTLTWRNPATHEIKAVNSPSDSKERSVADALGIIVHAPMPAAE